MEMAENATPETAEFQSYLQSANHLSSAYR